MSGQVRIVSDGTGFGTYVYIDGVPLDGVMSVEWHAPAAARPAHAIVTIDAVEVDVVGEQAP